MTAHSLHAVFYFRPVYKYMFQIVPVRCLSANIALNLPLLGLNIFPDETHAWIVEVPPKTEPGRLLHRLHLDCAILSEMIQLFQAQHIISMGYTSIAGA
jgi:hypothetical protein